MLTILKPVADPAPAKCLRCGEASCTGTCPVNPCETCYEREAHRESDHGPICESCDHARADRAFEAARDR